MNAVAKDIVQKIEQALEEIRPFLVEDGGDLELVDVSHDLVVKVELKGACKTCSMSSMTFKAGVEDAIRKAVPAVQKVEAII